MVGGLQPPSVEEEEAQAKAAGQGVIFVLENAQLEAAQIGKVLAALLAKSFLAAASRRTLSRLTSPAPLSAGVPAAERR